MEDCYTKYLKYKLKYISLKKNMMIGGGDKIDIMLFKAEWCGYCKSFKPIWNTLKEMPQFTNKLNFIIYDYDENKSEIEKFNVKSYPTLKIKLSDNNIIDYDGPREMEHMIEYLESI
jgi:thiol-disulfide isomerase/thioredoxin